MVTETIAIDSWHALLKAQQHDVSTPRNSEMGVAVCFRPENIITIALDADVSIAPTFRQRYFVCKPDVDQVFSSLSCPEELRLRWVELTSQQPPSYWHDFLAGPGSWLLTRLARLGTVVIWSERGIDEPAIGTVERVTRTAFPPLAAPFLTFTGKTESLRPRLISVRQQCFADVVAACVLLANIDGRDWYLADAAAREVYLVVNDEMVLVSVHDVACREQLLRDLQNSEPPFKDVSGYKDP